MCVYGGIMQRLYLRMVIAIAAIVMPCSVEAKRHHTPTPTPTFTSTPSPTSTPTATDTPTPTPSTTPSCTPTSAARFSEPIVVPSPASLLAHLEIIELPCPLTKEDTTYILKEMDKKDIIVRCSNP